MLLWIHQCQLWGSVFVVQLLQVTRHIFVFPLLQVTRHIASSDPTHLYSYIALNDLTHLCNRFDLSNLTHIYVILLIKGPDTYLYNRYSPCRRCLRDPTLTFVIDLPLVVPVLRIRHVPL